MKYLIIVVLIVVVIINKSESQMNFTPPDTKRVPVTDTYFGFQFTDFYRWLEDKDAPEVKEWSHTQHNFTVDYINKNSKEYPGLNDEIKNYIDRDYRSSPFFKDKREFFYSKQKGEQQNKIYTVIDGKEILIFDPEKFDPTGKSAISGFDLTDDGNKAAIGLQFKGNEINEYRIIDTKNGKVLGESIKNVDGFGWTKDEKHAYISYRSKEDIDKQIPIKTFLHKIGDDVKNDIYLFAPKDAKDVASIWDDDDADYTFKSEGDFYSGSLSIKKLNSNEEFKEIYSSKKFRTSPQIKNGKIYFYTNDNAPNFKIMIADVEHPEFENWKTFIAEMEYPLEGFVITKNNIIIQYKKDVISYLAVYDFNGKKIKDLEPPEVADVAGMSYHKQSNIIYVSFSSFNVASKLYKLDPMTFKWEFFYQDKPPIDTKDIESKQIFYTSKDGARVPMFLVYKKGLKFDGNNPTLLYGYGGFNISMGPGFVGTTACFINRGGVYAIACLRGGNEYGEKWHNDGMLFKKQNTFDDFYAAAEYLISEKYTNPSKLAVKGGSNGGLLIGAAITQRPDLFKAAICSVPLLDMLRYHKFLIARFWIPEYGESDKEDDFRNILKYSPYQNIKEGINYPTTLFKAGENDARVDPCHAKKMAAAIQNNPGQTNPILLFIDFESGHGSGQAVEQQVKNIELEWKWLMTQLGIN